MATQKAVVIKAPKQADVMTDRPIPVLRDDFILVKTVCVALNPTDWKQIDDLAPPGVLVGCDYAGTVQEVGKNVKRDSTKETESAGLFTVPTLSNLKMAPSQSILWPKETSR